MEILYLFDGQQFSFVPLMSFLASRGAAGFFLLGLDHLWSIG